MGTTSINPLIVLVGQTASGKTALALELAERWNGEIVAADSRTVYRGMDIGTAKPTPQEQARVRHHLLDIYEPNERCTVSDYQKLAYSAIADIRSRGKVPFLVGGTGLYIDAVIFNFSFRGLPDPTRRHALETASVDELQALLHQRGMPLPVNERNPRHLIRAIESNGMPAQKHELAENTVIMGMQVSPEVLQERITARVGMMLDIGLEEEVRHLERHYGWNVPSMQTIGYQEFQPYFESHIGIQEVRQAIITHTRQYAKRQKTWFIRNKSIQWISKPEEAVEMLTTKLNK